MDCYDKSETWSRQELDAFQIARLRETIDHAGQAPLYRDRLRAAGVTPESIRTLEDVRRIPLTTKDDLRASYPYGLLARPIEELVRVHTSSGTTGIPTAVFHTREDIETWASLMARCMYMVGIRSTDVFQNASGYGLFTGGLGIHYGAERLGCLTIPAGAGNSRRQVKLIQDFGVTALHVIPSYALHLGAFMERNGVDARDLSLRIALIGAEPHSEEVRRRIEKLLDVKAFNSYGLSEMNGPGVAFECLEQDGMHVWEDAFLLEIIDPETTEPVPEGEVGELVLTTLARRGMPILRYRTQDLTRLVPGTCRCGRRHRRIDRITGRADDMIIVKGVNIYPLQVEQVLMSIPEVGHNYLIVLEREEYIDQIHIQVEVKDDCFAAGEDALKRIKKTIVSRLHDELLVTPRVVLVADNTLPEGEGKAQRVIDRRNQV